MEEDVDIKLDTRSNIIQGDAHALTAGAAFLAAFLPPFLAAVFLTFFGAAFLACFGAAAFAIGRKTRLDLPIKGLRECQNNHHDTAHQPVCQRLRHLADGWA